MSVYIIGEIGINHNGDMRIVRLLMEEAASAGFDAVKFQKRTPELCVPRDQWPIERDTPWGRMTYIDYRNHIELGADEYAQIVEWAVELDIDWFASAWDWRAVEFLEEFNPIMHKVPSAMLTNDKLIEHMRSHGRTIMLSTGMSTMDQIRHAVSIAGLHTIVMHCTSTYPCPPEELNLNMIPVLYRLYGNNIGYSGHETGLQTTIAAVALGARWIERHITLDRTMWGTDQAASLEPHGMRLLVRDIRVVERSLGDGTKRVYDSEIPALRKLRGDAHV